MLGNNPAVVNHQADTAHQEGILPKNLIPAATELIQFHHEGDGENTPVTEASKIHLVDS